MNIDPVNLSLRAEIVFPHCKTAARVNSDLKNVNVFPYESREVPVINLKVVPPFPDARSFSPRIEKFLQWIISVLELTKFSFF